MHKLEEDVHSYQLGGISTNDEFLSLIRSGFFPFTTCFLFISSRLRGEPLLFFITKYKDEKGY